MVNENETELLPLVPNVKSIFTEMSVFMKTVNTMFVHGNCSNKIEKGNQSTHFTFNSDNTPNYCCLKSDEKEAALAVLHEKGLYYQT